MTRFSFDARAALRQAQEALPHPNRPNPPNPPNRGGAESSGLGELGRLGTGNGAQKKSSTPPDTQADELPGSLPKQSRSVSIEGSDGHSSFKAPQEDEPWSSEDYAAFFNERAAIAEFDGGLSRSEAEALAFDCCVAEWLNRNPICSPPDQCLGCGEPDQSDNPLLPFGAHANGYAWLHEGCWSGWCEARKAQAVAALSATGI